MPNPSWFLLNPFVDLGIYWLMLKKHVSGSIEYQNSN